MTDPETSQPVVPASRRPLLWFGLDLVAVAAFTVVGMLNHGTPLTSLLAVLWPFPLGLALAWTIPAVRALPLLIWPTGVIVWGSTTAVGLALRGVTGGGMEPSFVLVTALVLAALLLGWRVVPAVQRRRLQDPAS